jgi:Phage P22-like portal protein
MEYPIVTGLSPEELNEMEERRIDELNQSGVNELAVIADARNNLNIWNNYFNENIVRGKDDYNFCVRDQWTAIERSEFTRLFKPAMTFNKLYDAVKKIAGEQRKNKPDLLVRSLTGKATQQQIDLRADLVRTISYQSQNDLIYQSAFKSALMMGYGAFQIDIDYETPTSFNQIIKFNLIPDSTKTAFDPNAVKPHKGDGNYCSRIYTYGREEFAATYPYITQPQSYSDPLYLTDFQWETRDTVIVCDYYVKEWYPCTIYKLSNGHAVTQDQWEAMQAEFKMKRALAKSSLVVGGIIMDEIPKIVGERKSQNYKIMHYRMTQNQIIDFREWPSKYLPVIFVDGDSAYIEGKQYTKSFIHEARDSQKFVNYVGSEVAAEIKNRRREQWIGTPDNIIGNEQMWRNPELQMGILIAKPDPKTGQMPQKMQPWDISQQLLAHYQRGTQDMKEILGFFDENQGDQSNAQSGVAIANRQVAGSMSAYVFIDNLNQAIEQAGRTVLDLLPHVMGNDERHMIVTKADGNTQSIILNKQSDDGTIENSLEGGDYDIEIDTGPSFAIQKAQSLQLFLSLVQANPQVFPLVADLIAKNLDIQYMSQVEERFKTLVPPAILAKEAGQPPPPPQPNPQMQMQQMQMQQMQAELQLKQQDVQLKQQKQQYDQTKMAFDAHKLVADIQMAQSDNQLDHAKLLVEAKKVAADIDAGHADRAVDLHKAHLAHNADMHNAHMDRQAGVHKTMLDHHAKMAGLEQQAEAAKQAAKEPSKPSE